MNNISFIGSGNVSYHLSKALKNAGYIIHSISSRNPLNADNLALSLNTTSCPIEDIDISIDLLIICVSDDALSTVIEAIPTGLKSVVHTSGSISTDIFNDKFENYGVFYPLQSFKKTREIDISDVPILIEANNHAFEERLKKIALRISNRVEIMDSEDRKYLHLAAVFANNFVNHLATEAYGILENKNIDGSLLQPLLLETVLGLENSHPREMQTGPAKRNDKEVIKKQEELLKLNPKLQSLYRQLSQQIMQRYNGSEL